MDFESKPIKTKKPFLKRGEGTTRRVFASRYKDEAKRKREENQRKAIERQRTSTLQPKTKPSIEESSSQEVAPFIDLETLRNDEDRESDSKGIADVHREDGSVVDGSCAVDGETRVGNLTEDAKRMRPEHWLESQRRNEERQWAQAMELQEFEALERQIAEETRTKLEEAEGTLRKKHVTFRPPSETDGIDRSKQNVMTHEQWDAIDAKKETKGKAQNQRNVQKLKSISLNREKAKTNDNRTPSKTRSFGSTPLRHNESETPRLVSGTTQSKRRIPNPNQGAVEDVFVVDESFLDHLVEQDFHEDHIQKKSVESFNDDLFREKLKLQSMKEDFEIEKQEWQRKQVRVLDRLILNHISGKCGCSI